MNFISRKPYQVRNILLNPNYCGRVINKYGTFNDIVPPIINVDTFEEAQGVVFINNTIDPILEIS